jgi:hypothetical protein
LVGNTGPNTISFFRGILKDEYFPQLYLLKYSKSALTMEENRL